MQVYNPFAKPMYVMAKPVGAACNMACRYCYYLEKQALCPSDACQLMSDDMLERFIRDYIESQQMPQVMFTWHGGEALLRPRSFYEKAMALQQKYACGRHIDNCLQTNGLLLDNEWCRFFRQNNWLVGISIDGPETVHDAFRRTRSGAPTHHRVMEGVNLLCRHGVDWNALAVVNSLNAAEPLAFYRFFKSIDCRYLQFTPIVERRSVMPDGRLLSVDDGDETMVTSESVTPEQWGSFLCAVYDEWVKADVGTMFVQLFDATLANWMGVAPGVRSMSDSCGHAGVMEWNGDVFSCDHFVFPAFKLGNICEKSLLEMMYGEKQQQFAQRKQRLLPWQCRRCQWFFACHGECPKNRFCHTTNGEPHLNYLCEGYRQFFSHVAPTMDYMKRELDAGRAPANVMDNLLLIERK